MCRCVRDGAMFCWAVDVDGSLFLSAGGAGSMTSVPAAVVMQVLWWVLPLGLATAQLLLMRGFTLHGQHLSSVRRRRQEIMAAHSELKQD